MTQKSLGKGVGRSQSWVSGELLSDTQRVVKHLWVNEPQTLERLAATLNWSVPELVDNVGVALPRSAPASEVAGGNLRSVLIYDTSNPEGSGRVVGETTIPGDWQGEHRAYRVEGDGTEDAPPGATVVVRMDTAVELGTPRSAGVRTRGCWSKSFKSRAKKNAARCWSTAPTTRAFSSVKAAGLWGAWSK